MAETTKMTVEEAVEALRTARRNLLGALNLESMVLEIAPYPQGSRVGPLRVTQYPQTAPWGLFRIEYTRLSIYYGFTPEQESALADAVRMIIGGGVDLPADIVKEGGSVQVRYSRN